MTKTMKMSYMKVLEKEMVSKLNCVKKKYDFVVLAENVRSKSTFEKLMQFDGKNIFLLCLFTSVA